MPRAGVNRAFTPTGKVVPHSSKILTIRFRPGSNPITGTVVHGNEETDFTGWIELTGLLEAAHSLISDEDRKAKRHDQSSP